jgi:hypothetical protein
VPANSAANRPLPLAPWSRALEPLAPPDRWPRFVSVSQTAYVLDCTIDRVRHLLRRRILKGHKLGGEWIVESQSIRDLAVIRPHREAA